MTDAREEWIAERMAIMAEGETAQERAARTEDLRTLAERQWELQQRARSPKKQKGMFK